MTAVASFEIPLCWKLCLRLCKPLDVVDIAAGEDPHCGAVSAVSLIGGRMSGLSMCKFSIPVN